MDIGNYKKKVASRYIPLEIGAVGLRMLESDAMFLSVKLDGHLTFLISDGKSCHLENARGKTWDDLPLLEEAAQKLKGVRCTIAGELYVKSEGRSYGFEVPGALSKAPDSLAFGAFDIVESEPHEATEWQAKFNTLKGWLGTEGMVHMVPQQKSTTRSDIGPFFQSAAIEGDAEGVVVRHELGPSYKIKPSIDVDLVVMGYCKGFGEEEGMLRELLVGFALEEGAYQIIGQVGNGLTHDERRSMLETLKQSPVDSEYMEVSGNNVAFTMIPPEHVVQVRCLDVLTETSKGVIRKARLKWEDSRFAHLGMARSASLVAPVIEGLRTDKNADAADAGMEQINRWIDADGRDETIQPTQPSQMLRREVFVKESKGIKAVRKFMAWKTNKEDTGEWPAYVFSLTDFSPTRKDALKKSLSIASSEKEVMEVFEEALKEKVKRGWEPVQAD